jgi:cyclopropane fatty-acyl-phospholipid synthase-like methyltransferase
MAWFKNWFNTPYYHLLYRHRNEAEAELFMSNILAHLSLPPDAHLLDLACGKGRHARFMAQKGYDVTGIDLSEQSIAAAQAWSHDKLHFYVQDMREIFRENAFDAVFNMFTSFGYFSHSADNVRTLQAVHCALKSKGILLIDFLNTPRTIAQMRPSEQQIIDGVQFDISRKVEDGFIVKSIAITDGAQKLSFEERVQAITLPQFSDYLRQSGFAILQLFGTYHLTPYEEQMSDRLIIVAQKQ